MQQVKHYEQLLSGQERLESWSVAAKSVFMSGC
jgi:hypothetical protein